MLRVIELIIFCVMAAMLAFMVLMSAGIVLALAYSHLIGG